ncbi:MAG TPA: hypothetical protein VGI45_15250 [Terracidiphilus sp.]|jgi:hypothetical protein
MTPDPYRVAYETALAEITEIAAKFEQLRTRKGQIENLIDALQPVFAAEAIGPEAFSPSAVVAQEALQEENPARQLVSAMDAPEAEGQGSYSYLDVPAPLPEGDGDPFQRRAKTSFRFRGLAAQRS